MGLLQKLFGTHSENELKRIYPIVDRIEALEPEMQKLSDAELRDKTREYKERYAEGESLDDLLPEAYATVREASVRVLGMRHFRVQLVGGVVLHQGRNAINIGLPIIECPEAAEGIDAGDQVSKLVR